MKCFCAHVGSERIGVHLGNASDAVVRYIQIIEREGSISNRDGEKGAGARYKRCRDRKRP